MSGYFNKFDSFSDSYTKNSLKNRWIILLVSIFIAIGVGSGGRFLEFSNDYRMFFSKENPELSAFEKLQSDYTKNDNFLFVIEPADGEVFSRRTLSQIEELTALAWKIPYAIRVDSLSNFQHTVGIEDDLIVEDMIVNSADLSSKLIAEKKAIALAEPLIVNNLLTPEANAAAINVIVQYPQKTLTEVPEAAAKARNIRSEILSKYPDSKIYLTGVSMLNNAFSEAGFGDIATLIPLMFLVIIGITLIMVRSLFAVFATLLVIVFSIMTAMGSAGYAGIQLSPISGSAPIIILTLAIADSIHILTSLRKAMRDGLCKTEAIIFAIRHNVVPVTITSLTTIVGFLALNLSDAPPFWHLGNITAVGVFSAWVFSLTLLPALISLLPYKVKFQQAHSVGDTLMVSLANIVIAYPRRLLLMVGTLTVLLIAFIPSIDFNDQWTAYFSKAVEFRRDSDRAAKHFGLYPIEYSVPAADAGGISDPEYLVYLERFTAFLRSQENVVHVYAVSDILKRLNKNLHNDAPDQYLIPANRALAAQYLLLYELSLPYGLDLNDRINVDKSATRVTATLNNVTTEQTKQFLHDVDNWIAENFPDYMRAAKPTSAQVMFTYITERNLNDMIFGTLVAVLAIAIIMMFALRSISLGFLSLVPNTLPILAAFGIWALLIGEVGFSVATIASISLGIIIDDTVHLLTKYARARRENTASVEEAIRYAFSSVGLAIVVNTIILVIGFLVLTSSTFKVNVDMGLLTVLTILLALILDFLLLPALLLLGAVDLFSTNSRRHKGSL
ncbi:MAG: MMPL family transporter [Cellvibrionaceae bacterium]|nr:MMPL family transporter [Cellvibrionaceae bacterium]